MNRKPSRKPSSLPVIRQGDVLLQPAASLPAGCTLVPLDRGRIVLAYGEMTGHAHAIADHGATQHPGGLHEAGMSTISPQAAAEIAEAAIARAKLWRAPDGSRYLEVREPVTLTHEEHTQHTIPPGVYRLPAQVEYVAPEIVRQVAD